MRLVLVAAVAANGVIGADGDVPWHYPEDLAHFKETTVGHPVIMGRRTFESVRRQLGGPLPERHNVVLSTDPARLPESVAAVDSPAAALREAEATGPPPAYVVGGGTVYEQFLPAADELVLTELDTSFEGDTTFPTVDWDRWDERDRDRRAAFDIATYVRTDAAADAPGDSVSE